MQQSGNDDDLMSLVTLRTEQKSNNAYNKEKEKKTFGLFYGSKQS